MGFGSNYQANESAVQAPATAPGWSNADGDFLIYLPSDLDGATWANLFQAFKAGVDWTKWTKKYFTNFIKGLISLRALIVDGAGTVDVAAPTADTPYARFYDGGGNLRWLVDHNGYPMGRRCEWRQEWNFGTSDGRMAAQASSVTPGGTSDYPATYATKTGGTANGDYQVASNKMVNTGFTGLSLVLEMEVSFSTVSATNTLLFAGLLDSSGLSTATNRIGFLRNLAGGNWQGVVTGASDVDLGVVPSSPNPAQPQRLRLEVHGSASPYGSGSNGKVRFFINEALVGETAAAIPSSAMAVVVGSEVAGGPADIATNTYAGAQLAAWNRYLSLPAL